MRFCLTTKTNKKHTGRKEERKGGRKREGQGKHITVFLRNQPVSAVVVVGYK